MRSAPGLLATLVLLVSSGLALGEPVRVELLPVAPGGGEAGNVEPRTVRLSAHSVAAAEGGDGGPATTAAFPGAALLDLDAASTWELRVAAEGWWAPPAYVIPRSPGPARGEESPQVVTIFLRPTAEVVGVLVPPRADSPLPEEVSVRFEAADGASGASIPRSTVSCPVDDLRRFRCDLPVAKLDLGVRAEGFVSHYLWDRDVKPGEIASLGALRLVHGASMVGWVVDEAGEPLPPEAGLTVTAVPRTEAWLGRSEAAGGQGRDQPGLRVAPNGDGFFQLTGMVPGDYVLWLEAEGFAPTESPVVGIVGEREAEIVVPLVIRRPLDLVIHVDPPADESGEPWDLVLVDRRLTRPVASGSTNAVGRWRATDVSAGPYAVAVKDSRGRRVLHERIELDRDTALVSLTVERIEVEGEVLLGDEPLPRARVFFGSETGAVSLRMLANQEGRFSGWVPRAGEWRVDVRSRQPPVYRRLAAVEVEESEDGSPSRVVLELPDSLLEGQVVDGDGRPVDDAVVVVQQVPFSEMPSSDPVDENGRFQLRGLAPGTYRLQAVGGRQEGGQVHSAPVDVHLSDDAPYAEARLVLETPVVLSGRVVSQWGGVPGAKVVAMPLGGPVHLLNPSLTRPDGSFRVALPAGTERVELTVQAPGYVLWMEPGVAVVEDRPVTVRVEQGFGGTLRLGHAEALGSVPQAPPLSIRYDGHPVAYSTLVQWARVHQSPVDRGVLTLPQLPPGSWTICRLPASDDACQEVFLAPGGVLDVDFDQ